MNPINFPESNISYGPPPELDDSQCGTVRAYQGNIERGSIEGMPVIVTAYQPTEGERLAIANGAPIYLSMICSVLVPHMLTVDFHSATHPR